MTTNGYLALNAGSSSLKFALYPAGEDDPIMVGLCERFGADGAVKIKDANGDVMAFPENVDLKDHGGAMHLVIDALKIDFPDIEIAGCGHRVVHGGPVYNRPVVIDDKVLKNLNSFIKLAPLH